MEACPLCGRTHPARWERWQAVGRAQPGDLVGPVCAAKSPLMRNVYGTVWRILAVESISKHDYPRLLVEPVEPGPWADEGEEMRVEVDGSKVFPIEPR